MQLQTISYNPDWHSRLLEYMKSVYPHRDIRYLEWWITNIDHSDEECWKKCTIILGDGHIIGCTTVNDSRIILDSKELKIYSRGNTIVSPNLRGKGISKEIYNRVNLYDNWLSVGVTDIAWKIQPKYVKSFTPINPVNIYISFNLKGLFSSLFRRLFRHKKDLHNWFPTNLELNRYDEINRVRDITQLFFPKNGKWTLDDIEFVRDYDFFRKRYIDIYCSDRYAIYEYLSDKKCIGYFVLRKTQYRGIDMLSLVDYRFHSREEEIRAFRAVSIIARNNGLGFVITLSSRLYGFHVSPFTIRMRKKLNCAIGMNDMRNKFNDVLITSADSDLDFVYYN